MSKNVLYAYANEITSANNFILKHKNDLKLMNFLNDVESYVGLTHSDRWSLCYDFLEENYPEYKNLTTGLAYWIEA